jgi:hypothetical protein
MVHRVTFFTLALAALFTLQFADCLSPLSADQQTMQCCASMSCNPTNQSHDCCKTMVFANALSVLPAQHAALSVPVTAVVDYFSIPEAPIFTQVSRLNFETPQHSPPELYTLHSSLLI